MRRLGFITDVHADVHALQDALRELDRLGCDPIVCGGDVVDYGLFPEETLALLRRRKIPCVRGNHDRWMAARWRADEPDDLDDDNDADAEDAEDAADAEDAEDASGSDLSPESLRYLAERPLAWDAILEDVDVAVRHGSPRGEMYGIVEAISLPDARRHLEKAEAEVPLVGHSHRAFVLELPAGALIANPGALLRDPAEDFRQRAMLYDPGTGKFVAEDALPTPGTFGVLELPSKRFTVHRAKDGVEVDVPRVTLGIMSSRRP